MSRRGLTCSACPNTGPSFILDCQCITCNSISFRPFRLTGVCFVSPEQAASLDQLKMAMRQVQLLYLNNDLPSALAIVQWVSTVAPNCAAGRRQGQKILSR